MSATTGSRHETTFTPSGDRELVVARAFDAPRSLVWDAHTKPEHVKQWLLGPGDGWTMPVCEIDLQPGGKWRYVWRGPDGIELKTGGEYREIAEPERLVQTELWNDEPPAAMNTVLFAEDDNTTTVTWTVRYDSETTRDMVLESRMKEGWAASNDRLDGVLRGMG